MSFLCVQKTCAAEVHCFAVSKFASAQPDSCVAFCYESAKENQTSSLTDMTAVRKLATFISLYHAEIMVDYWTFVARSIQVSISNRSTFVRV